MKSPRSSTVHSARTPKACLSCRKMKQKCNAFERYPDPCTRCERKAVNCVLDGIIGAPMRSSWTGTPSVSLPRILESSLATTTSNGTVSAVSQRSSPVSSQLPVEVQHQQSLTPHDALSPINNTIGSPQVRVSPPVPGINALVSGATINENSKSLGSAAPFGHQAHPRFTPSPSRSSARFSPQTLTENEKSTLGDDKYSPATAPQQLPTAPPFELDEVYTICGQLVSKERLVRLYATYFKHYHPVFPVIPLDLMKDDAPRFDQHKMLFWAICVVASSVADAELSTILLAHVRSIMHSRSPYHAFSKFYENLAATFALIIMSYWALGTKSIQDEVAWLFNSLAHHLALQADLHHTQHFADIHGSMPEKMKLARAKAWVAVAISNIQVSIGEGFTSTVTASGLNPTRVFRGCTEFEQVTKQYLILRLTAKVTNSLGNDPNSELGLSYPETRGVLYRTFLESFAQTSLDLAPMSSWTELNFLCCKLVLHEFMLLPDTLERDTRSAVVPLYETALRMNNIFIAMRQSEATLLVAPLFTIRGVVNITVTLYKLLVSSQRTLLDERETLALADQLIDHLSLLTSSNNGPHWSFSVASSIRTMYQMGKLSPVLCSVRSRMGCSVLIGCGIELMAWRRSQGKVGLTDVENQRFSDRSYTHDHTGTGVNFADDNQRSSPHRASNSHDISNTAHNNGKTQTGYTNPPNNTLDDLYNEGPGADNAWGFWSASPWTLFDNSGTFSSVGADS